MRVRLVAVGGRGVLDVAVAATVGVEVGLGQRVSAGEPLRGARGDGDAAEVLAGQRIDHGDAGERDVAGVGDEDAVVEHVARCVGGAVAIAAGDAIENFVDAHVRCIDQRHFC